MKRFSLLLCLLCVAATLRAQANVYGDVAVIVNDASATSLAIGNHFAQQRGISPNRILHITAPLSTDIDSVQFEQMRAQIEAALITGNLLDSINYLVTTKGIPAQASVRNGCDTLYPASTTAFNRCTSTESELSLILGPRATDILKTHGTMNPYRNVSSAFDRDSTGIFLVSRLDGYTLADAMALVDHGGPDRQFFMPSSNVVLDGSGFQPGSSEAGLYAQIHSTISTDLGMLGYQVLPDPDQATFVPNGSNVIQYLCEHHPDSTPRNIALDFLPGSSASMWLDLAPIEGPDPLRYMAGDVIAQGAGVVASLAGTGYNGPNFSPSVFMRLYGDTSAVHRNAAESFYLACPYLSLQSVLYGDPKTSIVPSLTMAAADPTEMQFALYPNPSRGHISIRLASGSAQESKATIIDMQGKVVLQIDHKGNAPMEIDASDLPAGLYMVRVIQGKMSSARKLSILH
jgi:uncharacterized protein (TIGR03790 family)